MLIDRGRMRAAGWVGIRLWHVWGAVASIVACCAVANMMRMLLLLLLLLLGMSITAEHGEPLAGTLLLLVWSK